MKRARLALGLGCETGADAGEVIALAERVLTDANANRDDLAGVYSIDLKADEPAIHAVSRHFGVEAMFYDAAQLETETPRLKNPSARVYKLVGCHGVAEAAALVAVGPEGELVVPKTRSARATAAIARSPVPIVNSGKLAK
ncbi:MAG: cobalamin biosynthesis protein [Phyllobacterium sp.]